MRLKGYWVLSFLACLAIVFSLMERPRVQAGELEHLGELGDDQDQDDVAAHPFHGVGHEPDDVVGPLDGAGQFAVDHAADHEQGEQDRDQALEKVRTPHQGRVRVRVPQQGRLRGPAL